VFTQVSLVLLVLGTTCGALCLSTNNGCQLLLPACSALLPQVFTQVSLVLLLWGTMCGGLCLISDVGHMLLQRLGEGDLPGWVNGRSCMAAVAVLVLFPLCLQRHMREVR
jgi:hypothetical protein